MPKILCHTSLLKVDDFRLKDQPPSSKMCEQCDLYNIEDIHHLLMQCPGMYHEQKEMHEQISLYVPEIMGKFTEEPHNVFFWLIGRNVPDISEKGHMDLELIAGRWIYRIYRKVVLNRRGIG